MICRILLLISLTSCVSGMFEPQNTALKHQAAEGNNITVEWRFSARTDISVPSLKIHCVFVLGLKVFYHLDNSVNESLHEQFAGRTQCDKDALRTGRVRLHLSRVRTNDSGLYLCRMATGFGRKVKQFSLNITAAVDEPVTMTTKPVPAITIPVPPSRERICFYVVLGLAAAAAAAVLAASCSTL
ncbi:uncharacterized protein LOC119482075 isoform X2 [Sebastes umbrosus]|nr:uncharacterized protein LOC119482075 isoform X2 [Sebastes umbrosus]